MRIEEIGLKLKSLEINSNMSGAGVKGNRELSIAILSIRMVLCNIAQTIWNLIRLANNAKHALLSMTHKNKEVTIRLQDILKHEQISTYKDMKFEVKQFDF